MKIAPALALVSSLNPASYLAAVHFTASITNAATGTVTFQATGVAFSTNIVSNGSAASLAIANLPGGTDVITAIYSGDGAYLANISSLSQVIVKDATGLALGSNLNPSGYRTAITFTATVTNHASGAMIFLANGLAFSTNAVNGGNAVSFSLASLPPGSNVITAIYSGDSNYLGASNAFTELVNPLMRYEAENAAYAGSITVGTNAQASGGKYLYLQASGTITWTITNVPSAGQYNVNFGYCLPYGYKEQFLWVNGVSNSLVAFQVPTNTWQATGVSIPLTSGTNTISLQASWGYMDVDYLELVLNTPPIFASTPVNRTIPALLLMSVTNPATESDVPAQTLSYQLLNPPAGAEIDMTGLITWTPDLSEAPSTNQFVTVVSDDVQNATNTFQVIVIGAIGPVQIVSPNWSATSGFQFSFDVPEGVDYTIQTADSLNNWTNLSSGVGQAGSQSFLDTNAFGHVQRFYRLRF